MSINSLPRKDLPRRDTRNQIDESWLEAALNHKPGPRGNFGFRSLTSLGVIISSSWASTGGTITLAFQNGGPMAAICGLIFVSIFYTVLSVSLADLTSFTTSSEAAGPHSTVSSRKRGHSAAVFTGYLNACAWLLSAVSMTSMLGNEIASTYLLHKPSLSWNAWYSFMVFQIINWTCCAIVCFGSQFISFLNWAAPALSICGLFITVVTVTFVPKTHAPHLQVCSSYQNIPDNLSDCRSFLAGLLSATFFIGTPDFIYHISDEKEKFPRRILPQMFTAFTTSFIYLIALFYSIQDLDGVYSSRIAFCSTAEIYHQATGSSMIAIGLIAILFLVSFPALIGTFVTGGRLLGDLAQDDTTPFASYLAQLNLSSNCPVHSTVAMSVLLSLLGCICVGSTTAFQALVSCFAVLSFITYMSIILPHVLSSRRLVLPSPSFMRPKIKMAVNIVALLYIMVTMVFFCFPLVVPVTLHIMNYLSVIIIALMLVATLWWLFKFLRKYCCAQYKFEVTERLGTLQSPKHCKIASISLPLSIETNSHTS